MSCCSVRPHQAVQSLSALCSAKALPITLFVTGLLVTFAASGALYFAQVNTSVTLATLAAGTGISTLALLVFLKYSCHSTTPSGLPGNFLGKNLNGICWANAFLQGLRLLDDELKESMHSVAVSAKLYDLVAVVSEIVYKLDHGQQVSVAEMEEFIDAYEKSGLIQRDEKGYADLHFEIEKLFQAFLDFSLIRYQASRSEQIDRETNFTHNWHCPAHSFHELMQVGYFHPVCAPLPKTLIVQNLNHELDHDKFSPDDSDGLYHCTVFNEETQSEEKYTYRLKGVLQHHKPYAHFTMRVSNSPKTYIEYNDAHATLYQKALRIEKNFIYAFFERVD